MSIESTSTRWAMGTLRGVAAAACALMVAGGAFAAGDDGAASSNLMSLIEDSRWVHGDAQQQVYMTRMALKGAEVALDHATLEVEESQVALARARGEVREARAALREASRDGDARWIATAEAGVAAAQTNLSTARARIRWARLELQARKALVKQLETDAMLAEAELELARSGGDDDQVTVAMRNQVLQYQDHADEASSRTRRLSMRARMARAQWESAQEGQAR